MGNRIWRPAVRVGKVWDSEFPWDVRVEKVCGALRGAGHEVHLVCRNRHGEPLEEEWNGVHLHRMPVWRSWPAAVDRASSFPAFVNPRWLGLVEGVFRRQSVDLVLCRDLPLAPLAVAVAKRLRRPIVVDIAEHYAGLLRDLYNAHDFKIRNVLLRNPYLALLVERLTLPRTDGVLVVVEEMRERLVRLGVPAARITVVSNTPTRDRVAVIGRIARSEGAPGGRLRLVYLGNVERSRGLEVVIEALGRPSTSGQRCTLDVFGDGSSLELHRAEVSRRGLTGRVVFHGRLPYDEVLRRLGDFDVGVIPHFATDHWNYTVQNKLFDYMAAGLAVLVSSMPPAARIVTEVGAGRVFADRDPESVLRELAVLADAAVRRSMGDRGRRAVVQRYNWDHDGARLAAALEGLVSAGSRRASPVAAGGRE